MDPLVSVIIPTYNRPNFLPNTLKTIREQTYNNIEVIVVNDAGSEVGELIEEFPDLNIQYCSHKENKGLAGTRNTGIEMAKGDYFCFLDDDDGFYPFHVGFLLDKLMSSEKEVVYSEDVRIILERTEDGKSYIPVRKIIPLSLEYDKNLLLIQNITPVNAVMCSKKALGENRFDENLPVYEDWDMWLKISENYPFEFIGIPTCYYTWRQDGSTMSSNKTEFSTELPTIYNRYRHLANAEVKEKQNEILNKRGMPIILD